MEHSIHCARFEQSHKRITNQICGEGSLLFENEAYEYTFSTGPDFSIILCSNLVIVAFLASLTPSINSDRLFNHYFSNSGNHEANIELKIRDT